MKILVGSDIGSYTFDKVTKKVTLGGLDALTLDKILLITDVTNGIIIYKFNGGGALGGSIASNVITLNYDTNISDFANTDQLQIFVDYPMIPIVSSPQIVSGTSSWTRPNDTTAYAVSDVVGTSPATIISISALARQNNKPFKIKDIRLFKSSNITANANFGLYIFNAEPTAIADNAQWTMLNADKAKYIGKVNFSMFTEGTGSTGCMSQVQDINLNIISADSKLYGVLVANSAYVPAAQEIFDLFIDVEQQ